MSDFTRRLPVYLVLDCSASMSGEPIESVKQCIKALISDLKSEPQALETAFLSVITFDSVARQTCPLTELILFKEPELVAYGTTALGSGLRVLKECIENEVRFTDKNTKGDWKPLVFLLTDGEPTDSWREHANVLKSKNMANIIACAAGTNADIKVLKQITENVVVMNTLSAGELAKFFVWVSDSIVMSSRAVDAKPNNNIQLPTPPKGFTIV